VLGQRLDRGIRRSGPDDRQRLAAFLRFEQPDELPRSDDLRPFVPSQIEQALIASHQVIGPSEPGSGQDVIIFRIAGDGTSFRKGDDDELGLGA
jgi:hypothetical protein